jgi:predicted deacylase
MERVLGLVRAFGAPVAMLIDAPQSGGRSFTAASIRQGVTSIATEMGGAGTVSPASRWRRWRDGMRRACWRMSACCSDGRTGSATGTRA